MFSLINHYLLFSSKTPIFASMNSLGIDKSPKDTRVVVAMSGGVDSSVTAALLHEEGYDVVGVTLQLYDHGAAVNATSKTCCAGQDIQDARRVADERGFPHYVLDYETNFRQSVMDDFADSYLRGETPIPCVKCNQSVKFRDLLKVAKDLGADCMATGHYIKREIMPETGRSALYRAHDHGKDQSYFLFATTQEQLDFLRFPLGVWSKDVTRDHARRLGLVTADKPDSQDICFVPHGDYTKVVKKMRPEADRPGDIVDLRGNVLGRHDGIIHYTIGQRRGLGIGGGHSEDNTPFFVIRLEPETARVVVGPKEALARGEITIEKCNWLMPELREAMNITVKFRSTMQPIPARLTVTKDGISRIHFNDPQYGISAGQAAVVYDGDRVLGGGWIMVS